MGHNLDLVRMLGVPNMVHCDQCGKAFDSFFDDYDIDCGDDPNPSDGHWELLAECPRCDHIVTVTFEVTLNYTRMSEIDE